MNNFKVGDWVERIAGEWIGMVVGDVGRIVNITKDGLDIEGYDKHHSPSSFKLCNSVGKQLFGKKIKVTPELSELVQLAVIETGGGWLECQGINKIVDYLQYEFLYISVCGVLSCNSSISAFNVHKSPEVKLEIVKTLKIVEEIPPKSAEQVEKEATLQKINELEDQLNSFKKQLEK